MTYLMAGRARQHIVLAGDFMQLPPVKAGDGNRGMLDRDAFEFVGVPDAVDQNESLPQLVRLRTQYRMRPDICRLASVLFYDGQLRTAPEVRARATPDGPLGGTLHYLHTGPRSPRVERTSSGSRKNGIHAELDEALVDHLLLGPDGCPDRQAGPVALLTPFVGQRQLLERRLRDRYPRRQLPIATVHQSQGEEYETVILDLVDARGLPLSRFLQANRLTAAGARLLNVGLTRAVDQLIVVGEMRLLATRGGRVVQQLVQMLGSRGVRLSLQQILRGTAADQRWEATG